MLSRMLLLLCLLPGPISCGTAGTQAPAKTGVDPAPSGQEQAVPADFSRRECALYEKLDDRLLTCTLRENGAAGRRWLETVGGRALNEGSLSEQLELIQQVLLHTRELTAGELADVGWFVAEALRERLGGRYRRDPASGQIVLDLGQAPDPVAPMLLVQRVHAREQGLDSLRALTEPAHRPPSTGSACQGVQPVDVLQLRLTRGAP